MALNSSCILFQHEKNVPKFGFNGRLSRNLALSLRFLKVKGLFKDA